jgi:hypothetical protein
VSPPGHLRVRNRWATRNRRAAPDPLERQGIDGLVAQQRGNQTVEIFAMCAEAVAHLFISLVEQPLNFGVDMGRGGLAVVGPLSELVTKKGLLFVGPERDRSQPRHTPVA